MGIFSSKLPTTTATSGVFPLPCKSDKYSRIVQKVISYLNFINVLSKWHFLCSKPEKDKAGLKTSPNTKGGNLNAPRTAEDPEVRRGLELPRC